MLGSEAVMVIQNGGVTRNGVDPEQGFECRRCFMHGVPVDKNPKEPAKVV